MHIRCPHCKHPVEIVDESSLSNISCSTCGNSFHLVGRDDSTESYRGSPRTISHFQLLERLGMGTFGCVWKARDTDLDRIVAVKIPRRNQLTETEIAAFFREARAAAQVRHPNIVPIHEIGREDEEVFIVSDFIDGATLKDWARVKQPSAHEAAKLCEKIAAAIHHAHENGVVHRDLKPTNIMIDRHGEPHIMDFGLAKREQGEITVTVDGQVLGTPAYMSPEQASGKSHHADRRADVYSLGVIFFELLTTRLPFRGENRMLIVQIVDEAPPSPREFAPDLPSEVEAICLKCLAKDPDRRYATAEELADDLRNYLNHQPVKALADSVPKILILDESPADLEAARLCIEREGYKVISVTSERDALDALDVIAHNCPDIVLADLEMSGMGGFEFIRHMKAQHPKIPVIAMTAHGNEDAAVEALQAGAACYIPKQAMNEDLAGTIRDVLRCRGDHLLSRQQERE